MIKHAPAVSAPHCGTLTQPYQWWHSAPATARGARATEYIGSLIARHHSVALVGDGVAIGDPRLTPPSPPTPRSFCAGRPGSWHPSRRRRTRWRPARGTPSPSPRPPPARMGFPLRDPWDFASLNLRRRHLRLASRLPRRRRCPRPTPCAPRTRWACSPPRTPLATPRARGHPRRGR